MALNNLELSLQFGKFDNLAEHKALLTRARVTKWIKHALAVDAEMAVRIVGIEEGHALNLQYRKKDYATNVLTFDYQQEPTVQADLVICGPVIEREAKEQNKSLEEHYAHMIVHGTLHARAGTTKPARKMPKRWRPTKPTSCRSSATPTPTPKTEACPPAHTSSRHGSFFVSGYMQPMHPSQQSYMQDRKAC